jgi:hypothetical protein
MVSAHPKGTSKHQSLKFWMCKVAGQKAFSNAVPSLLKDEALESQSIHDQAQEAAHYKPLHSLETSPFAAFIDSPGERAYAEGRNSALQFIVQIVISYP